MLMTLSSAFSAFCMLCRAAADEQSALLMLQIHADASIAAPAIAQGHAAVDAETNATSGECLPPIEWMDDAELHKAYSSARIDELLESGGLETRQHPTGHTEYRIQDWAKQWKSEHTMTGMFKQDTMSKLLQHQILLARRNPDCPEKLQYKVERSYIDEASFSQVFDDQTIHDFLKAQTVERRPFGQGDFQYRVTDDLGFARLTKRTHQSTTDSSAEAEEMSTGGPKPEAEVMSKVGVDEKVAPPEDTRQAEEEKEEQPIEEEVGGEERDSIDEQVETLSKAKTKKAHKHAHKRARKSEEHAVKQQTGADEQQEGESLAKNSAKENSSAEADAKSNSHGFAKLDVGILVAICAALTIRVVA